MYIYTMMTSSNGNIFHVIGHLCGEFPGLRGQWRGALMFSLIRAWINGWENNREAGDLRRQRAHYNVIVMHRHVLVFAEHHSLNQGLITFAISSIDGIFAIGILATAFSSYDQVQWYRYYSSFEQAMNLLHVLSWAVNIIRSITLKLFSQRCFTI